MKSFQRGINHPVLFFFFQVKKLAVHKVAPVSSSALLRFFMGIVLRGAYESIDAQIDYGSLPQGVDGGKLRKYGEEHGAHG